MPEPFVGEIRLFAGTFAPVGWSLCDGQLLTVSENDVLFSLLGTTYGGDGLTTFGLPDLRGRVPIHMGRGPGLSPRALGATGGTETATVTTSQLPAHTHQAAGADDTNVGTDPAGGLLGHATKNTYRSPWGGPDVAMADTSLSPAGGSQPHGNMMPFQVLQFIISLFGVYPSRQ